MRLGMATLQKQTLNQNLLMRVIQTSEFYQLSAEEVDARVDEEAEQNPALRKVGKQDGAVARRFLRPPDETLTPLEDRTGASETLTQALLAAFRLVRATEPEQIAAQHIIGNLNQRGFVATPLPELAEATGLPLSAFTSARDKLMNNVDPEGCGADDVRHFLTWAFVRKYDDDPFVADLIQNHLEDLWKGRFNIIEAELGMDPEDAEEYRSMLSELPPFPAQGYIDAEDQYVEPSFEVVRTDQGTWGVRMLKEKRKEVELNTSFLESVKGKSGDEKKDAEQKIREAKDLMKQLEDRQTLLEQVAVRAVEAQQAFFHKGPDVLRNLTRSSIAVDIGVDDSQVSRIVKGEYFLWRGATHHLAELFTYRRVVGDDTSAPQLKALMRRIVDDEDPRRPLSDREIMEELGRRGVRCKLRTVNKYRRLLDIPSSHRRRKKD